MKAEEMAGRALTRAEDSYARHVGKCSKCENATNAWDRCAEGKRRESVWIKAGKEYDRVCGEAATDEAKQ